MDTIHEPQVPGHASDLLILNSGIDCPPVTPREVACSVHCGVRECDGDSLTAFDAPVGRDAILIAYDTLGQAQPSGRGEGGDSVGHEDLRCGCGCLVAFTPHTEVFLMSARHADQRHNVRGQYN